MSLHGAKEEERAQMVVEDWQPDAAWKKIQQNTFTRWVNKQLKCAGVTVTDLETDFEEGLKLIRLVEVLSGKSLGRYSKKVTFRHQKLENISLALRFLEDEEHIKLVNIDSSAIVDSNLKLILGLVWTLILHYSIAKQDWDGHSSGEAENPEMSPKVKLMSWLKGKLPTGLPFSNFTSDWNDGILLGALVDSCAPGLEVDWREWVPSQAFQSTRAAMQLANDHLGVAALITPEELINPAVDEKSVMTYLAQFPGAKYTPPLGRFRDVNHTPLVGVDSKFALSTRDSAVIPEITIVGPDGSEVDYDELRISETVYEYEYQPKIAGEHEIMATVCDRSSGDSVQLTGVKVVAMEGAHLLYDRIAELGKLAIFTVENAGNDLIEIVVFDPNHEEIVIPVMLDGGTHKGHFTPKCEGVYSINVFQKKNHICGSPFLFDVVAQAQVIVWGRGIEPEGIRTDEEVAIFVDHSDNFLHHLTVRVLDASGNDVLVSESEDELLHRKVFKYIVRKEGNYEVSLLSKGQHVGESPYKVVVSRGSNSNARAFGPGLEGGVANLPCVFLIEAGCGHSELIDVVVSRASLVSGKGFQKPEVKLLNNKDGSAAAQFTPTEPGIYTVKVYVAGEHIKDSPFVMQVQPTNNNLKMADMRLSGVKPNFAAAKGQPVTFKIDVPDTGVCLVPFVKVLDATYAEVPVHIAHIKPGQYECRFIPEAFGRYYLLPSLGGVAIPGSPFVVEVREMVDTSRIRLHGVGIGSDVHVNQPVSFVIDPEGSRVIKNVSVVVRSRDGIPVDVDLVSSQDGTFTATYVAPKAGPYEVVTYCDDVELPKMDVTVKPLDVSSILIDGLDNETVTVGQQRDITVDTGALKAIKNGLEVIVEEANGLKYMVPLGQVHNSGIYKGQWLAKNVGGTKFSVFFDESLVREIPVTVRRQDASRCRAHGVGLESAVVGAVTTFRVDMMDAGEGKLKVAIKGPSESKVDVKDDLEGSCTVEYVPQTPGLYEISICFGDEEKEIPGSPFTVMVDYLHDPSKVLITGYNNGHARSGLPTSFIIDATHTALGPIDARLPAGFQQPLVEEIKPRVYRVTFTPSGKAGETLPLEVLYGGELLHGRSMDFTIDPEEDAVVIKDYSGSPLPSSIRASFQYGVLIDTTKAEEIRNLVAELKGPDGKLRKAAVKETSTEGVYLLQFVPDMAGTYAIAVCSFGKPIHSKPYEILATPVGSASKCFVEDKPVAKFWVIGEPRTFTVNIKNGGDGALNVVSNQNDLEVEMEENDDGSCDVTLTPHNEGAHRIVLMYGGSHIPNGTINFECVPPAVGEVRETHLKRSAEFDESGFSAEKRFITRSFRFAVATEYKFEKLSALVKMPSGEKDIARIKDNEDGSVTVTYQPRESGNHILSMQHDGVDMAGSPISFYVSETGDGYVTVYGTGLSHAVVGEPAPFTVCAKGSPSRELSVAVEGTAKATIKCHDNKDGTCSVAWVPPVPGEYKVHIKLSGKPVEGSPFNVFVLGEGQKRAHLSVGSTSEVSLNVANADVKGLSASIKSPSGIEEPCFIRQIDSSTIGVSFTPREEGEHQITVKKNGRVIPKSPFRVNVDKNQVGDASKVVISGPGKAYAICQQYNDVTIDTKNAGYGGLSVSVEGPSKAELKCTEAKEGLINIAYRPTEPGIYILSIKFADVHVKDSPFTVRCTGKGLGAVRESVSWEVKQAPMVMPGQDAFLFLQMEDTSPMDITAKVMDPSGRSDDVEVRDLGSNFYQIKFKPGVDGPHAVSVFHKGQHVLGSPFQFTVGHLFDKGAHRVRAAGVGLLRAETNKKQSFNLYTREAGRGDVEVTVEGPSKAELQFFEHKDGNCHFDCKVSKPGEYLIAVKFNNEHIPDSPFKVFVAPATGEARRLELASFPDSGMPGKACTFTVLTHRAPGHLEAKVYTPSNKTETIDIVPIDEGESYALRFIPTETGNYYVDVTLDGAPMRDSPFRLRIGASHDSDPTAITVSGDGIHSGETGRKCEFLINTCNAGTGLLQIQIDGPSKVTLDAYEMEHGYKVRYMALAPGAYYVAVKYSGAHIPGSPFKVIISGKELGGGGEPDTSLIKIDALAKTSEGTVAQVPVLKGDASKVVVKGAGLNKFFPGRPAAFSIDTGVAGENLLFVGVLTTKGPCEEVTVRHVGSGRYVVTYRIQERIKGFIFIKYGETNVPGSPFAISP